MDIKYYRADMSFTVNFSKFLKMGDSQSSFPHILWPFRIRGFRQSAIYRRFLLDHTKGPGIHSSALLVVAAAAVL